MEFLVNVLLATTLVVPGRASNSTNNIPVYKKASPSSVSFRVVEDASKGIKGEAEVRVNPPIASYSTNRSASDKWNIVLSEDFSSPNFPPTGWEVYSTNTADSTWHRDTIRQNGNPWALVWWSFTPQREILVSPQIVLSGSPTDSNYYLVFLTYAHKGTSHTDHYYVVMSRTGDTTWTDTLMDFAAYTPPDTGWVYTYYNLELPGVHSGDTIRIGFIAEGDSGLWYVWGLDDIMIRFPNVHDVGIAGFISPLEDTLFVGSTDTAIDIRVQIANYGVNTDTFDVVLTIDSANVQVRDTTITFTLGPDTVIDTTLISAFQFKGAGIPYTLKAYTILATDEDHSNDTIIKTVVLKNTSTGGPDGYGYTFITNDNPTGPTFEWIDPTSGTALSLSDDSRTVIHLPFSFPFYSQMLDSFYLSSNGWLGSFEGTSSLPYNDSLPTSRLSTMIAFLWDDFNPSAGGQVYYYVPSDSSYAVIGFVDVPHYGGSVGNTFEVVLYPNGNIRINLLNIDEAYQNSSTIGIQDEYGAHNFYLVYTYNGTPAQPHDSLSILFVRPTIEYDLVLQDLKIVPMELVAGNEVKFIADVQNAGANPDTGELVIKIYDHNDNLVQTLSDTLILDVSQEVVDTLSLTISTPDRYKVEAVINSFHTDPVTVNDTIIKMLPVVEFSITLESGPDKFVLDGKWQWGEDPGAGATSGTKVLGTILNGNYENHAHYIMTRKFVANADTPLLTFTTWYAIEYSYDGGVVKVIRNTDTMYVVPLEGYPGTIRSSTPYIGGLDGFTGYPDKWETYTFPIPVSAGDTFDVMWEFASDGVITKYGWYIDDIGGTGLTPVYPAHDIAISEIKPSGIVIEPGIDFQPIIKISNFGINTEDVNIEYEIDSAGVPVFNQIYAITVPALGIDSIIPDPYTLANEEYITYTVKVRATISNTDEDTTNNYMEHSYTTFAIKKNLTVPVAQVSPNIDGVVDSTEWADALKIDISDVYGAVGTVIEPGNVWLYMKVDTLISALDIAVVQNLDNQLTTNDQIGLYFDDNGDGSYPAPSDSTEGAIWLLQGSSGAQVHYKPYFNDGTGGTSQVVSMTGAIGTTNGKVSFELLIPFGPENYMLNTNPGDSFRLFAFHYNAEADEFYGYYPQDMPIDSFLVPAYYGLFKLPQWTGIKEKVSRQVSIVKAPTLFTGRNTPEFVVNVPANTEITVKVYDIAGRTVSSLKYNVKPGLRAVPLTDHRLRAGVYFVQINVGNYRFQKKIMVLR